MKLSIVVTLLSILAVAVAVPASMIEYALVDVEEVNKDIFEAVGVEGSRMP